MNAPNASGWKPGTPVEGHNAMHGPDTATGNRALMLEEPLIFEIGSTDTTGVDFEFAGKLELAGVEQPKAPTPMSETTSRLGAFARTVKLSTGPLCPLLDRLPEHRLEMQLVEHTMVRVVHVPAALESRGYPAGLTATVDLAVDDPVLPGNHGRFRLRVQQSGIAVTVGLTNGVTTGRQSDRFFIIHGHACEGFTHICRGF